jgi:hypothetical protein
MNINLSTTTKVVWLLAVLLSAFPHLAAQSTANEMYTESFRKGSTRVVEESFDVKLSPQDSQYRERIKDAHGDDHYVFSILPKIPEGDTQITAWQVKLADLRHPIYDNILLTSPNPSSDPQDALWLLWPSNYAAVPIRARRVLKVDGFYVVLQVKAFHFTPLDSPYLDSMTVTVAFRNTDPRQTEGSAK